MNARIIGGITGALNDGPVRTKYGRGFDGKPTAQLVIGKDSDSIAISVTDSPAETLALLEEKVAELRAWVALQEQVKNLPELAS